MTDSTFTIPDDLSFESAIALTQSVLAAIEEEKISEAELRQAVSRLVASQAGARGFLSPF